MCANSGYQQYEVSTFTIQDKFKSKHNLGYWRGIDYIGIGPGAHGRFTLSNLSVTKTFRVLDPNGWIRCINDIGSGIKKSELIDAKSLSKETAVLGLRTLEGIDIARYKDILDLEKTNDLLNRGFLSYDSKGRRIAPTSKGLQLMDTILPEIIK
jgi:oxygen-independent coproporphyrinogen-3 oxidase